VEAFAARVRNPVKPRGKRPRDPFKPRWWQFWRKW
jgi:hypothetical protein